MKIVVNINKRVALLAGGVCAGQQTIEVPEGLTKLQREELSHWTYNSKGKSLDDHFYLGLQYYSSEDPMKGVFASLADTSLEPIAHLLDQLTAIRKAQSAETEKEEREKKEYEEDKKRLVEEANKTLSLSDLVVEYKNGCYVNSGNFSERYSSFSVELPQEGPFKSVNSHEFKQRFPAKWNKAKENAERQQKEAKEAAQKIVDARASEAVVERNEWIRSHGSDRLQMILEEDMIETSMAVYRDEKLAIDRPGWIWDATWHDGDVEHNTLRNPTEEDLLWYRDVKKAFPTCETIYAFLGAEAEDHYYEGDKDEPLVKEMAITDRFLGKDVVLRKNLNDEEQLLKQWQKETRALLRRCPATTERATAMAMVAWLTAEYRTATCNLIEKWEEIKKS